MQMEVSFTLRGPLIPLGPNSRRQWRSLPLTYICHPLITSKGGGGTWGNEDGVQSDMEYVAETVEVTTGEDEEGNTMALD